MSTLSTGHGVVGTAGRRELRPRLLAALAGLASLGTLSTNIILPSFPGIAAHLGVGTRDMGLTLSSFFLAFALGQLVAGPASDRWGRRRPMVAGLALFAIGSAVCAAATTLPALICGRVLQALGACAASVLARAIARDLFNGETLARALGLMMVAMAAAPGLSPLLGSVMESGTGWRGSFALVGLLCVALWMAYVAMVGETHPPDRRAPVTLTTVLSGYRELGGTARFTRPALGVSAIVGGLYAFFAATPEILMGRMGLSAMQLGLFFAATVIVVFAAGLLAPRLAHRWGAFRIARAGGVIAFAGGVLLLASGPGAGLALFTAAIVVFLFGMGLLNPLGTALALEPFGRQAGLASALLGCLQMVMAGLASLLSSRLPLVPEVALGWVLCVAAAAALGLFFAGPLGSGE